MPSSTEPRPVPRTPGTLALNLALRELREENGIGVRELARNLDLSPARVSGLETERLPSCETVARILGFLRTTGPVYQQMMDLAREAPNATFVENHSNGKPPLAVIYEQSAVTITEWAPRLIPEIVRAPGYLRTLLSPTIPDPEVLDRQILTHIARTTLLTAPACKPHRYTLLLSEAALHPPGMNAIDVLEQLHLLLAISKGSKVALRLVRESDYPADLHGARVIYKLGGIRAVAVLPQPDTSIYLSKPTDVEHHDAILKAITQKALDKQQSRAAVAEAIEALAATHSGICGTDEAVLLAPSFAPFEGSPP